MVRIISIHAPRAGSDLWTSGRFMRFVIFQSTLPVRGATILILLAVVIVFISIHAPRAGSDEDCNMKCKQCKRISIHAPRAGSDQVGFEYPLIPSYFNPRSPCGERRGYQPAFDGTADISIHAPRAGSDYVFPGWKISRKISIHAPRAGSDGLSGQIVISYYEFQSTLPVRGATLSNVLILSMVVDFNPRSPCGERRKLRSIKRLRDKISIHAPRAGSD